MCSREDFLQPSLGASDNSDLVLGKKKKKPKFIFPLNYFAAYLSSFKGISDESSSCSSARQERGLREGKVPRERGLLLRILSPLSLAP